MLKYIHSFCTIFTVAVVFSQVSIFEEDFQKSTSLSQWKIVNEDQFTPAPEVAQYSAAWIQLTDPENPADTVVSATSYFTSPGRANRWLISPPITLGTFGNYLSWSAKSFDPSFPEDYNILISRTDDNIESFTDTLAMFIFENYIWSDHDLSLSNLGLDNEQIYIAFVLTTYDGNRIFLDDIKVRKEDNLGVSQHTLSNGNIFPNPATTFINLSGIDFDQASVYSATGKLLEDLAPGQKQLNVSDYEQGIYYLHLSNAAGVRIEKFFRQ